MDLGYGTGVCKAEYVRVMSRCGRGGIIFDFCDRELDRDFNLSLCLDVCARRGCCRTLSPFLAAVAAVPRHLGRDLDSCLCPACRDGLCCLDCDSYSYTASASSHLSGCDCALSFSRGGVQSRSRRRGCVCRGGASCHMHPHRDPAGTCGRGRRACLCPYPGGVRVCRRARCPSHSCHPSHPSLRARSSPHGAPPPPQPTPAPPSSSSTPPP